MNSSIILTNASELSNENIRLKVSKGGKLSNSIKMTTVTEAVLHSCLNDLTNKVRFDFIRTSKTGTVVCHLCNVFVCSKYGDFVMPFLTSLRANVHHYCSKKSPRQKGAFTLWYYNALFKSSTKNVECKKNIKISFNLAQERGVSERRLSAVGFCFDMLCFPSLERSVSWTKNNTKILQSETGKLL